VTRHLFALERYEPSGGQSIAAIPALAPDAKARLVAAVHLSADDVVLFLVEGPDVETVAAAAASAGWQVDRLYPAAWVSAQISTEATQK
jgi:hypothetical protein